MTETEQKAMAKNVAIEKAKLNIAVHLKRYIARAEGLLQVLDDKSLALHEVRLTTLDTYGRPVYHDITTPQHTDEPIMDDPNNPTISDPTEISEWSKVVMRMTQSVRDILRLQIETSIKQWQAEYDAL